MKRVILLFALFCCLSFKPVNYATTWTATALNQGITLTALKDAVTNSYLYQSPATTIPTSLQLVTKNSLLTYNIFTGSVGINSKSSNQVITKGDFYIINIQGNADNCGNGSSGTIYKVYLSDFYSNANSTTVYVYTDNSYTTRFTGGGAGFYYSINGTSGASIEISSTGVILSYTSC